MGSTIKVSIVSSSYYKMEIDGKEIANIDVFNRISNVNGQTNSKIRRLLGLI